MRAPDDRLLLGLAVVVGIAVVLWVFLSMSQPIVKVSDISRIRGP